MFDLVSQKKLEIGHHFKNTHYLLLVKYGLLIYYLKSFSLTERSLSTRSALHNIVGFLLRSSFNIIL